jgi:hypothetical protein
MARKEVIKTLRNKVPVEYIRDQYFEDSAELPQELRIPRTPPEDGEDADRKGKPVAGIKRSREVRKGGSLTLRDHIDDVKGQRLARFLTDDLTVAKEVQSDELEKGVESVDGTVAGVVVDRAVDQKLLDRLVGKGLAYVAAKDFKGIIKRPLSIRLIKMGS